MNSRDLLKAIGEIDDKYLIEEKNISSTISIKLKYILIPICIIVITYIGVYKSGIFSSYSNIASTNEDNKIIKEEQIDKNVNESIDIANKDNWIIKEIPNYREISESIARVQKWDEMPISQQFMQVKYNNSVYASKITEISSDNILRYIDNSVLTGYDVYTQTNYEHSGELYSIKNISDKCAIAVKFEGDINYYVYLNLDYRPTTLREFMSDLNLKEITSFGTIYYNYWDENSEGNMKYKNIEFYNVDNNIIWQMLFSDMDLENIYSDMDVGKYTSERFSKSINISVDIPLLGYKNISVSLTDKGYLITNILDTGKGFYIGENKVQEFLNYIKENYDGYEIVYIDENDLEITDRNMEKENNVVEEKIMMIENTVNRYVTKDVEIDKMTRNENKTKSSTPNN